MRALLGTASHFCEVVVLKLRTLRQVELTNGCLSISLRVKNIDDYDFSFTVLSE